MHDWFLFLLTVPSLFLYLFCVLLYHMTVDFPTLGLKSSRLVFLCFFLRWEIGIYIFASALRYLPFSSELACC